MVRLQRARTEAENEEALRLGKAALRHLVSVEHRALERGVDEPGRGLLGALRRAGPRPEAGLERLIEDAEDRIRLGRSFARRKRREGHALARTGSSRALEEEFGRLEKRERGRRKAAAKEDENAPLRMLHLGKKTPRQKMSGEEAAIELGF